jgi:hypothetical protein
MQDHRIDGVDAPSGRANPSPSVGNVCGLGESHALRIELRAVQLPWLADEIHVLRGPIEEELARTRAQHDQLIAEGVDSRAPEAVETSTEIDRRIYQLKVLAMIREQLPLSDDEVAAGVASPWEADQDHADASISTVARPVVVVGPAQGMFVMIDGAAYHVAAALTEALAAPRSDVFRVDQTGVPRRSNCRRITPPVAARLRALAAAAAAFTDTYVNVVLQQSYRFDPDYDPVFSDELW